MLADGEVHQPEINVKQYQGQQHEGQKPVYIQTVEAGEKQAESICAGSKYK